MFNHGQCRKRGHPTDTCAGNALKDYAESVLTDVISPLNQSDGNINLELEQQEQQYRPPENAAAQSEEIVEQVEDGEQHPRADGRRKAFLAVCSGVSREPQNKGLSGLSPLSIDQVDRDP